MPAGINVVVEGDFATVSFQDKSLRGITLAEILKNTTPKSVGVDTSGPTKAYVIPTRVAEASGLIDAPAEPEKTPEPEKAPAKKAPVKKTPAKKAEPETANPFDAPKSDAAEGDWV